MEVDCLKCKTSRYTGHCKYCGIGTLCERCMLCTNKGCFYWAKLISPEEYQGTAPYSYSPQQTSKYFDIYSKITKSWEPEEKPEAKEKKNKRKRDDNVEQKHA